MLHEIEGVERDIRAREDLILEEMEKAEALAAGGEARGGRLQGRRGGRRRRRRRELDARAARLAAEAQRLAAAERDAALASVPEDARALYARVAQQRGTARRGGAGRHVPDLPREDAAAGLGRGPEERAALPVRVVQPRSSTTSRRRRPSSSSRDAARPAPPRGRREPRQPRRGRLRRPRHRRRTGSEVASLYGYLGRATNNVAEYQALLHGLRFALARGASRGRGLLRLGAARAAARRAATGSRTPASSRCYREAKVAPRPLRARPRHPRPARAEPRGRRARQPGGGREVLERLAATAAARLSRPRRRGQTSPAKPDEADHAAGAPAVAPVRVVEVGAAARALGDVVRSPRRAGPPRRAGARSPRAGRGGAARSAPAGRTRRRRGRRPRARSSPTS